MVYTTTLFPVMLPYLLNQLDSASVFMQLDTVLIHTRIHLCIKHKSAASLINADTTERWLKNSTVCL